MAVSRVTTSTTGSTLNKNCEWRPPPQLLKSAPVSPLRDRPLFAGRPAHRGGWLRHQHGDALSRAGFRVVSITTRDASVSRVLDHAPSGLAAELERLGVVPQAAGASGHGIGRRERPHRHGHLRIARSRRPRALCGAGRRQLDLSIGWTHPRTVDGARTKGPSSSPSAARSRPGRSVRGRRYIDRDRVTALSRYRAGSDSMSELRKSSSAVSRISPV